MEILLQGSFSSIELCGPFTNEQLRLCQHWWQKTDATEEMRDRRGERREEEYQRDEVIGLRHRHGGVVKQRRQRSVGEECEEARARPAFRGYKTSAALKNPNPSPPKAKRKRRKPLVELYRPWRTQNPNPGPRSSNSSLSRRCPRSRSRNESPFTERLRSMEADAPDSDTSLKHKADDLHALVSGPLAAAVDKAFGRSRGIPSGRDFHFFDNFDEFKAPVREIKDKSESSLRSIAASGSLWGSKKPPQLPDDLDDAYDWVVNLNDEFLDRLAVSMDEFKNLREKEEEAGGKIGAMDLEGGFQLVYGKKKKGATRDTEKDEGFSGSSSSTVVNVATKDKRTTAARSKVPFHIPTIPRPQDQYNILVNNNNQPFEHVWLERSRDGRFIHPLVSFSWLF
ncbi:hypothetical protein BHE74_00040505 [Ensete ventricosum]|nr:hypothetical protein BHE74_00040505 [Ensete ventricosum]